MRHVPDRPGRFTLGLVAAEADVVEQVIAEIAETGAVAAEREGGAKPRDEARAVPACGAEKGVFHRDAFPFVMNRYPSIRRLDLYGPM